jgi:hypothetical protein
MRCARVSSSAIIELSVDNLCGFGVKVTAQKGMHDSGDANR